MSGLNTFAQRRPHFGIDAVGADDQVVVAIVRHVACFGLKFEPDARGLGAVLQNVEQPPAADAAEAVAGRARDRAAIVNRDVVPVDERFADRLGAVAVILFEIGERIVGQNDAPAERVVRAVALDDDDVVRRIAQLQRDRKIEAGRPASETCHAHEWLRRLATTQDAPNRAYYKYKIFEFKVIF